MWYKGSFSLCIRLLWGDLQYLTLLRRFKVLKGSWDIVSRVISRL